MTAAALLVLLGGPAVMPPPPSLDAAVASPPSSSPPPALPPSIPPPAPIICAEPIEGDVALTSYPSGTMLIFKDGAWGTVCKHYTQDDLVSATVFCRQLGYETALEQGITEEDMSDYPLGVFAVQCKEESSGGGHGRGRRRRHGRGGNDEEEEEEEEGPKIGLGAPRMIDCHTHTCHYRHCGCTPEDSLYVTCGGAVEPAFPTCGSSGVLPAGLPAEAKAEGAARPLRDATAPRPERRRPSPAAARLPGGAAQRRSGSLARTAGGAALGAGAVAAILALLARHRSAGASPAPAPLV